MSRLSSLLVGLTRELANLRSDDTSAGRGERLCPWSSFPRRWW